MKVAILLGTRPEIIKLSPIIRECSRRNLDFFIIHSNQHYSENLDQLFFKDLDLPCPKYNLDINQCDHNEMVAKMLLALDPILDSEMPDVLIVQGDTNTVLAGALAVSKKSVKLAHVEAGLRSYDRNMPEEINRVLTDHISDYLFAPTEVQKNILLNEGIQKGIHVVGNTIVEAVQQNIQISLNKKIQVPDYEFVLVTAHRQENVDNKEKLSSLLNAFSKIHKEYGLVLVYPIHPRTRSRIAEFNLSIPEGLQLVEPMGYFEFLLHIKKARIILTDSGGVQEEACILKTPTVTLRENTERPETLDVGSNILAGTNPERILEAIDVMLNRPRDWPNPFGDGTSSKKIMEIILE